MAGRGPAPAPRRRRRNADPVPVVTVADDGQLRGPALPRGTDWHPRTRAWWASWRRSPQAQAFTATDWAFLLDTAALHSAMWGGRLELAAEVRLRAAKFGATPEDRARLRLRVETPGDAQQPAQPEARRARIRVVGED